MAEPAMGEIREQDAPPEIAEIYRQIREATGLPLVNLLWRHLATMPQALPWVWNALGPVYRDGSVAAAAQALRQPAAGPLLAPIGPQLLRRAGLDRAQQVQLRDLLEAYNRGNTQNLIGWSALLHHVREPGPSAESPASPAASAAAALPSLPPLPALPRRDDLAPAAAAAVARLAARHAGFPAGAVPSLYLHLATWPALLAPVDERLAPAFEAGRIGTAVAALAAQVTADASALAARLRTAQPVPAPDVRERALAQLGRITQGSIQEMIVVGSALAVALADG